MIKAIILDVDGVIVGEKIGYNSPYPHPDVISRLKNIRAKGITISLCTAKPHYAITQIITDASLNNLHITDGGAIIIDPIDNVILKSHIIDKTVAKQLVEMYISNGIYTEVYTPEEYILDKSQQAALTKTHEHILQRSSRLSESLLGELDKLDISKIMPVATDETDKIRLSELFKPFADKLTLSWGVHPIALPHQFGIITNQGISKQQAVQEIANDSGIDSADILGIGDSASDWQFIESCGYGATVSNGSADLKKRIHSKGDQSYIGGHVDENGVLAVFDYFNL